MNETLRPSRPHRKSSSPMSHSSFLMQSASVFFNQRLIMAIDRNKLDDLLKELAGELQNGAAQSAELLLPRRDHNASGNGVPTERSFFGIWDSGDPRSADNDRIDADLAREYDSHEANT